MVATSEEPACSSGSGRSSLANAAAQLESAAATLRDAAARIQREDGRRAPPPPELPPELPPEWPAGSIPRKVLLCVVSGARRDASMSCAVALLNLQTELMGHTEPVDASMAFVDSFDDAMQLLWKSECAGALVIDGTCGFDPAFATGAMRSGRPVVLACHPVPSIDWDRVVSRPVPHENPAHVGNTYNLDPVPGPTAGYARVDALRELGVAWVTRRALDRAADRHPDVVDARGERAAFCAAGVFGGRHRTAAERFLDLVGEAWTDLDRPASKMGPVAFQGCVGLRSVLR